MPTTTARPTHSRQHHRQPPVRLPRPQLQRDAFDHVYLCVAGRISWTVAHPAHPLEHESGSVSADESVQLPARGESNCPIAFASVALEPGDVLFIPRGWWHEVDAEGITEDGVSCSIRWCFS